MRHALTFSAALSLLVLASPLRAQGYPPADQQGGAVSAGRDSAASAEVATPAPAKKKARPSRTLITREQVEKAASEGASSAYEIVEKVRREWFRVRADLTAGSGVGAYAPNRPAVYFDNNLMGDDPEVLRQVKPDAVAEIRFLSGPDATTRFGTGYPHGVIQVISATGQ